MAAPKVHRHWETGEPCHCGFGPKEPTPEPWTFEDGAEKPAAPEGTFSKVIPDARHAWREKGS